MQTTKSFDVRILSYQRIQVSMDERIGSHPVASFGMLDIEKAHPLVKRILQTGTAALVWVFPMRQELEINLNPKYTRFGGTTEEAVELVRKAILEYQSKLCLA